MSTDKPDISIIVPIFNEVESVPKLAKEIVDVLESANRSFEVWMIDDGSSDGSWDQIKALNDSDSRFAGIRFQANYGKSAALSLGFEAARGRYVVTMDGDLQDDPAEVPQMIDTLEAGADLVSGWKKKRNDPLAKTVPSRFFNSVTRVVSGIPLHDFNCGLKAYRIEVVRGVRVYGEMHRYIPVLAKRAGFKNIAEQVVNHRARQFGETKFGFERFVRGFLDLISVTFLTQFAARPMHFFGTLGTLAFLGGLGINTYLSILWLMGQPIGRRPLLFLGMLLIILGVQLFSTGLLGEMIIRPSMESTARYAVTARLEPRDDLTEAT
ncbi:glycosyltransferase family 2 protein [Bacteroidota bacterium]